MRIVLDLAGDELGNIIGALEEYIGALEIADEPEDDQDEVLASCYSALEKMSDAARTALGYGSPEVSP